MGKDNELIITMDDNTKKVANIIFSFEINGDNYIFYKIKNIAYAAKYNDKNDLIPIENDEWEIVKKIFDKYQAENGEN